MTEMFCYQCQQAAGNTGCVHTGVCGKQPDTANLQDELVCLLIRLAETAVTTGQRTRNADRLLTDGLFTTLTNVNFDNRAIQDFARRIQEEIRLLGGKETQPFPLWEGETDQVSLRSTLLFGLKGMSAYAHHARNLGYTDPEVTNWFYRGLSSLSKPHSIEEWLTLLLEFGKINYRCMALLDQANTDTFGNPVPTSVSTCIQPGPFIVISGHDLKDLHQLLEQTKNTPIRVYTHSEMLPAHGYPGLKKYPHLAGNFGTAWQNQQKEFAHIPAPVLFTTNCLMPPKPDYQDRVYTTSIVGYPGLSHIAADEHGLKDFSPLIRQSLSLGGYSQAHPMKGINGGDRLTTGFGHKAVLDKAPALLQAIRDGKIRHLFLVGGCDGAHPGRNYYTEFVRNTPADTLVLTLACGKYRFNDMDLGEIQGIPRLLDLGQCNDAYSAIQIALALAEELRCSVNQLPLTLVLSWYEQKAVCILLTLLALGIKNIYLGPTFPAFFSETISKALMESYGLRPVTHPQEDLKAILSHG